MTERLVDISQRIVVPKGATKPARFYEIYERYFAELADRPITLLELGVFVGNSAKVFASYFRNGKIIAFDVQNRDLDFSGYPNVVFALGDQRNARHLNDICAAHAPDGLDIVIDDASHIGRFSWQSYSILYPLLKPGGFYIVEDWATGYWDDWPDGKQYDQATPGTPSDQPNRVVSHDFGMVGFIKWLVDETTARRPARRAPPQATRKLEFMHVHPEFVVLKKVSD